MTVACSCVKQHEALAEKPGAQNGTEETQGVSGGALLTLGLWWVCGGSLTERRPPMEDFMTVKHAGS